MESRLTQTLGQMWTFRAVDGAGELLLPKFVPQTWAQGAAGLDHPVIDRGRISVLRGAGWEIREIDGRRYLIPDDELARYAFGPAYDVYWQVIGGGIASPPQEGEFGDLVDAILHANALDHHEHLTSGARILYPNSFPSTTEGSIGRRVKTALEGGWVMVGLITDPGDLFLLPPENIRSGSDITPNDAMVGRGVLLELRRRGLISLRGTGFGRQSVSPLHKTIPQRAARGEEWQRMVEDQLERWGRSEMGPVVDLAEIPWLSRFSSLQRWLDRYRRYLEPFDQMRIESYLNAWSGIADMDALEGFIGGIKGVLGEIAARPRIVEAYREGEMEGRVLFVAPQVFSGGDFLERSDAVIARVSEPEGRVTIERLWEVITKEGEAAHKEALGQNADSLDVYRRGGIVFRRADGESRTFRRVTISEEVKGEVVVAGDRELEDLLEELRERLVTEIGIDLITERVRERFLPTFEDLKEIMREEGGVERLMEMLGGGFHEGRRVVVGCSIQGGKIKGLRLMGKEEAGKFDHNYFHLGFDLVEGGWELRSAPGKGSLDLALPWVEKRLGRTIDPVERPFLAGLLGTHAKPDDAWEQPKPEGLARHLEEWGIDRLAEIQRVVGQSPPEGGGVVVGRIQRDKMGSLRLMGKEEAGKFSNAYFHLGFDLVEGGWKLRSASGNGSLDLAVPWVEKRLGRRIDPVEQSFLAGLLGTHARFDNAREQLTPEGLVRHLEECGIDRLAEIQRVVGQFPTEGRRVVVGRIEKGKIAGLRLVGREEAGKWGNPYFQLVFDLVGDRYQLDREGAKSAGRLLELIGRDF